MAAIRKCAEKLLEDRVEGRDLQICTDSQASIMALEKPVTTSKLVQRVKDTLNELGTRNRVTIIWIPGHSGYNGYEKADKLAKQGADMEEQPDGEVGIPYQEGNNAISRIMRKQKWNTWPATLGHRWSKELLGKYINSWNMELRNMKRNDALLILLLFIGYSELRCYTHKTQGRSYLRRWCESEKETPRHEPGEAAVLAGQLVYGHLSEGQRDGDTIV
ncbi:uncharacterized protein LOC108739342 [Agrilus planipennis]|uniref:Uncharacterized protein LOC108739342 n=1 Tax=Agrilus planipennis TaxID=224129 RepID=A0A1W4X8N5_AGRPL|nr:uncharacterized protein LOC108739342 [Agrilus planipennis]